MSEEPDLFIGCPKCKANLTFEEYLSKAQTECPKCGHRESFDVRND